MKIFHRRAQHGQTPGDRGFALLVVLWSLVLVGLLTTQILASGRTALRLAGNLRAAAEAGAQANGAINEAIFHLSMNGADHWAADGSLHILGTPDLPIAVRINSLGGKINPNLASTRLLAGLFQALGAAPPQASQIATAIIEWRSPAPSKLQTQARLAAYRQANLPYGPPGHNFADLSELADVAGMPPDLLALALPQMSLFQSGDPNPAQAGQTVRRALVLSGQAGTLGNAYEGTAPVVMVEAVAGISGKLAIRRDAIVSLGQNGATPYQILSLTDGS